MVLIARNEMGLIKPGMQFVFIRELEEHIDTYCVDLNMDFKLSKQILNENFTIHYRWKMKKIDHIAHQVDEPRQAAAWYCENFGAEALYVDDTWAVVQFENIKLAFVMRGQHPPTYSFIGSAVFIFAFTFLWYWALERF
jgi:hypothetical protein